MISSENEEIQNEPSRESDTFNSILNSTKKFVGLEPENKEFDSEMLICINMAIGILYQLGVGPYAGYSITSDRETYDAYLPDRPDLIPMVKSYIQGKVRLTFEHSLSSTVIQCLKEQVDELEWRIRAQGDINKFLDSEGGD